MSLFSNLLTGPGGAASFRHEDDQPVTSAFDGQRFVLNRGDSVLVDGDPVLTIDDDRVSFQNRGTAETMGETATIDVQGNRALVDNQRDGEILAEDTGVEVSGARAEVRNRGEISGDINAVYLGSSARDAEITNLASGVISSDSRAVNLDGEGATLNNFGDILGTGNQRNGTVYANATAEDFTINNFLTGVIDAGEGNDGAAISLQIGDVDGDVVQGEVTNRGTIVGRGESDGNLLGDGIRIFSGVDGGTTTFQGTIFNGRPSNDVPAEIVADGASGIVVQEGVNFVGEIENRGEISGFNGIFLNDGDHDVQINNQARGVITGSSRAVDIDGEGVTLNNRGDILGTGDQRNGTVYVDATAENFAINNFGNARIDAGEGNQGAGISLQIGDEVGDVVVASVTNDGVIQGRGDGGANLSGDGIRVRSGTDEDTSTFQGDIVNRGDILASDEGIDVRSVNFTGNIVNRDLIDATGLGITVDGNVSFDGNIENHGTIQSDSIGIELDDLSSFTGNIENYGTIQSGTLGIKLQGNDGAIVFTGSIINHDRIEADDGEGILVNDVAFSNDIVNNGTILAGDDGIELVNIEAFDGQIINRGTITGNANDDDPFGDAINADGLNEDVDLRVINTGVLNGDVLLGDGDDLLDSANGTVNGEVFGGFGEDRITTGAGSDTLDGGSGSDVLDGGSGDDFLTGDSEADTFTFRTGTDRDVVLDFENDLDLLDVSDFFDSAADAVAATVQIEVGAEIVLDREAGDSVVLLGVNADQIDETDFIV